MAEENKPYEKPEKQKKDPNKKSELWKRRQERLKRVNEQKGRGRVRVNPRDDIIRRDIRHGSIRFPAEGSVEWPLDQFTKRRLRDGTVTLENGGEQRNGDQQREDQQRRSHRPEGGTSSGSSSSN